MNIEVSAIAITARFNGENESIALSSKSDVFADQERYAKRYAVLEEKIDLLTRQSLRIRASNVFAGGVSYAGTRPTRRSLFRFSAQYQKKNKKTLLGATFPQKDLFVPALPDSII